MNQWIPLLDKLYQGQPLSMEEYALLIDNRTECAPALYERARTVRDRIYGCEVYIRGLIEFSNYCKNDCYYCGIRRSNRNADRYRLTKEEILACCKEGRRLGFRTFVLQSGEDPYYTDDLLCEIVREIRTAHPDCAITLSLGERSRESYRRLREAGADRYLLRHETASPEHYRKLHPPQMSYENRQRCLRDLHALGYQVGAGFMVGSPYQTTTDLANELIYLRMLQPEMAGIGPFIPHQDTPFADAEPGTAELTIFMLGLIRLTLPHVLLPATTALGTVDPTGREKGIRAGANVVMPNLSPLSVRKKYMLYDNKICTGDESAQCIVCLTQRIKHTGCRIVEARGDFRA